MGLRVSRASSSRLPSDDEIQDCTQRIHLADLGLAVGVSSEMS